MSDEEKDKDIKERLHSIFPSPEVASAVVDLVVHNRPKGWSRRSNAPYYKEIYATAIKREIDAMIDSGGKELVFRYAVWCTDATGISPKTLYNRLNQSIRYLIDHMDTRDHKYGKWYEGVRIESKQKLGIVIRNILGINEMPENAHTELVEPKANMPMWMQKMEQWLESDEQKPFVQEGLLLSPEEIRKLNLQFMSLSSVAASVTSSCVKIIKIA